jgi:hypothetical protein
MIARKTILIFIIATCLLIYLTGNVLALEEGSTGGKLKIKPSSYVSADPQGDVAPLMPVITLIVSFFMILYGSSLIISNLFSGTKINAAPFMQNNEMRKDGQKGIIHSVGGLVLMCVGFTLIFLFWNSYGPGAW